MLNRSRPSPSDIADQSAAARIEQALAERIVNGTLAPGSRLMQDHLAEEFATSHVPVREAFRKLEAQGLLVSKPRCGVTVSHVDPGVVTEVTEMRAALESLALHHALPHLRPHDIESAQHALDAGEASQRIADWEIANRHFHLALITPCAMPRLLAGIRDLQKSSARFLFATWKELDWQPRSDSEHRAILDAVKQGKGERARALLEEHIRAAGRALVARLETAESGAAA